MNMKFVFLMGLAFSAMGLVAAPAVKDVAVEVLDNGNIAVRYALTGEDAVITPEFWSRPDALGTFAEMDPAATAEALVGDVNRVVKPGDHAFHWVTRKQGERQFSADTLKVVVKAWTTNDPPAYMVIDLAKNGGTRYYSSVNALPGGLTSGDYRRTKILFRKIPAADVIWRMGKVGHSNDAWAPRYVKLTQNYYMGVFPVTQGQWATVYDRGAEIGKTMSFTGVTDARKPSKSTDSTDPDATPVNYVSWADCRGGSWPNGTPDSGTFIGILRQVSKVAVDLPTNTQWEYACRAGTSGDYYNGGSSPGLIGWTSTTAASAKAVGQKGANPWGLYDMVGNVAEWVLDYKNNATQSQGGTQANPEVNPMGPSASDETDLGGRRIVRGGCWSWPSTYESFQSGVGYQCAMQWNYSHYNTYGLRLCVTLPE